MFDEPRQLVSERTLDSWAEHGTAAPIDLPTTVGRRVASRGIAPVSAGEFPPALALVAGLQPSPGELNRVEALALASGDEPLAQELAHLVGTVRGLVAAIQLLASELDDGE